MEHTEEDTVPLHRPDAPAWSPFAPPGVDQEYSAPPGADQEYSAPPGANQGHSALPGADQEYNAQPGGDQDAQPGADHEYGVDRADGRPEAEPPGGDRRAAPPAQEQRREEWPQSEAFGVPAAPVRQPTPPDPRSPAGPVRAFPDQPGALERVGVTADDFASRRVVPPRPPVAETGLRGALHRFSFGLLALPPSPRERAHQHAIETVRRNFGGLRQVTVVNPKGGAGKTVAVLMLAMTFGRHRGGYVLAWDNNETQGTLGMRAQQDFHIRTVRDLLRDLDHFKGPTGRVGDLSQYVRAQGGAMFDVLASDESATAGEMLTSQAFGDLREAVSRFYKLIVVDTGNNVRAQNWQSAIDATDQLVVTMSARNDSAETAARMLDHLEQTGRRDLVRNAVSVVSMPAHRKDVDLPAVQRHFAARTRAVLLAPYEKLLDSGEPIRYDSLSKASLGAWLRIGSAVAEGL
ncbi:chromosome partitioning protein [Glycomyces tenuis]|uniref:MinD/ParA family ATP-binding protein n=1 Tax=Glycomyces tenuis TaxID=58116 RepID=UPI0004083359|nr:chromosome partitioning protein [Glycomyces tenuis]